jgi:succinate dehydrogenase / fumarate reductase cytochrome b subunit
LRGALAAYLPRLAAGLPPCFADTRPSLTSSLSPDRDQRELEESSSMSKARPKHLNLFQIRQPAPAVVSILHRISGALLFLFLWLFLAGLERSLLSPESFADMKTTFGHPLVKLLALGFVWAYLHHTFAGLRHLGLDLRFGIDLPKARATAFAVLALSFGLTLVIGVVLW